MAISSKDGEQRVKARDKIIQAANRQRMKLARERPHYLPPKLFSGRQINQAVRVCRVWKLVPDKTLVAAGFNPVQERGN